MSTKNITLSQACEGMVHYKQATGKIELQEYIMDESQAAPNIHRITCLSVADYPHRSQQDRFSNCQWR